MVRRLLSLLLCISMPVALVAETPAAADDRAAVRAVVETYLHGLKFNDVDSLKQAFWPEAKLFFTRPDGSLGQLTQTEWYAGFAQSAGQEAKAEFKIASLEVTNDAASVKVVETYPRSRYTDYLSLIRIGGKWQIVNKIYTAQKLDGSGSSPATSMSARPVRYISVRSLRAASADDAGFWPVTSFPSVTTKDAQSSPLR